MKVFIAAAAAWTISQVIKIIRDISVNRKLDMRFLFATGGMPSSHSATVCSLAVAVALYEGWRSSLFGMACILALITMTDAASVRQAVGKQASVLNAILNHDHNRLIRPEKELRELLGHTPLQVVLGAVLGVAVALGAWWVMR